MHSDNAIKISKFAQQKEPFVALISYDTPQDDIVCTLKDAAKNGISFKFPKTHKIAPQYSLKTKAVEFEIYKKAFDKVVEYMKSGDVYLLNLCFKTPFSSNLSLSQIYEFSYAPLVVYLKDKFVCFSPEKFVTISESKITTYPMKGTIDATIHNAKKILLDDEKEFSEQAMITDLMRNDLSMVGKDVKVDKFRYFDKIKTPRGELYQTSTQISATLDEYYRKNYGFLFDKILPAGSITGTPKIRACEIIKEVELDERGFYSGIFIYFDGKVCVSYVLIRFVQACGDGFAFRSGGGITAKSIARKEFDEMCQKAYFTF